MDACSPVLALQPANSNSAGITLVPGMPACLLLRADQRLQPGAYVPLRERDIMRFGESLREYVLQPAKDGKQAAALLTDQSAPQE